MEEKKEQTKVCGKCHRELPHSAFNVNKHMADGLQSSCRECQAEYMRGYWRRSRKDKNDSANQGVSLHKAYAHPELARFTPRQLMEELKARGFKWEYMIEPQRKIMFDKI